MLEKKNQLPAQQAANALPEADETQLHSALYAFVQKSVHHRTLAEEITRLTLEALFRECQGSKYLPQLISRGKRIASRKITAYFVMRHSMLLDEFHLDSCVLDLLTHNEIEIFPGDLQKQGNLIELLHKTITELPEPQRIALLQRYFDGISVVEIAQGQRTSMEAVERRLKQARKTIRKTVDAYEQAQGIRLNCVGIVPLMLWLSRQYRLFAGVPCTEQRVSALYFGVVKKKEKRTMTGFKIIIGILVAAVIVCGIIFLPKLLGEPSEPTVPGTSQTSGESTPETGNSQIAPTGEGSGETSGTATGSTETGEANPTDGTDPSGSTDPTETNPKVPGSSENTQQEETVAPTEGPSLPIIPV